MSSPSSSSKTENNPPPARRGRKPSDSKPIDLPVLNETRTVEQLRQAPVYRSLQSLQDRLNEYFVSHLPTVKLSPSKPSLALFLGFASVKEMMEYSGNHRPESEVSYKRLIALAILRIEALLNHLTATRQSSVGPMFLLKTGHGYSEVEVLRIESDGVKVSKEEKEDLKQAVVFLAEKRRERLNVQAVNQTDKASA